MRSFSPPLLVYMTALSTLSSNPNIYVHENTPRPSTHTLSLLPTSPPLPSLSLGTTTALPPTPRTFAENRAFHAILSTVLRRHARADPFARSQAAALASPGGLSLGSPTWQDSAGGASAQGGAGGAGVGGWIHVSDLRNPPDWGRVAWPEDILGSLEVDANGRFVGQDGNWQESGTYRVCTNEGILGLSPFLVEKLVEHLKMLDAQERAKA
ncbi:hypothetical protein BDY21DRAFT_420630 [Lineolata rhizophorae]|uniref:Uncharacterized protein n=1 Tax=Lineolata rhizophorae TaxID=578093 RepID=A0A6A6P4A5_9PEZI|nr:hypothetical protein BDY21DRAFT_420630 [Lineolata rhizophorae]